MMGRGLWKINSQRREIGKRLDTKGFEKWFSTDGFSLFS